MSLSLQKSLRFLNHGNKLWRGRTILASNSNLNNDVEQSPISTVQSTRNFCRSAVRDNAATKPTKVTLIQGDGVYPEIMDSVQHVLHSMGAPVEFEPFFLSDLHASAPGASQLDAVVESVRRNGVCLKGTIGVPEFSRGGGLDSVDMRFRHALDYFASVVTIKSHPGIATRHQNIDMVIIKEQLEGFCKSNNVWHYIRDILLYFNAFFSDSALEHESVPGVVECLNIVTEQISRRLAKLAFDYATQRQRKRVTAVHKANIMKLGDGLFLRACRDIAKLYPEIEFETMIVDNCSMQLVSNPHQFDVMVMPNLYGDILINLGAGMVGGAGVTPGVSYSADTVAFEPGCKHTFSAGAGKNCANPTAMLYAAADMLAHLSYNKHSRQLREAVDKVIRSGKVKTKDLGGHGTTKQFVQAVIENLR